MREISNRSSIVLAIWNTAIVLYTNARYFLVCRKMYDIYPCYCCFGFSSWILEFTRFCELVNFFGRCWTTAKRKTKHAVDDNNRNKNKWTNSWLCSKKNVIKPMCWGRSLLWSWSDCCAIGHIGRDDTSAIVATILCMTTEKKSKQLAAIYIFDVIRPPAFLILMISLDC